MNLRELETNAILVDIESTSTDEESSSPSSGKDQISPSDPQPSTSKDTTSMRISVQRGEISSTAMPESADELELLDVEAYDQQTYEQGIFNQVNKAITSIGGQSNNSNESDGGQRRISDLMHVIHAQDKDNSEDEETCDIEERDNQLLQLTRLERLRKNVKSEPVDRSDKDETVQSLPKIPKIKQSHSNPEEQQVDVGRNRIPKSRSQVRIKQEQTSSSDDESVVSEYKPTSDQSDDAEDDQMSYESESEIDVVASDQEEDESKSKKRTRRTMEDDGDFKCYQARIKAFNRKKAKLKLDNILEDGTEFAKLDEMVQIDGCLEIPKEMWDSLFEHQRTGLRWLWELHQLGTGGILGDEMGLGKTIQTIAFLTALKCSNLTSVHRNYESLGPTVLVCPATVMHQWLLEFRKWWPPFRVAILHSTGTFSGDRKNLVQAINKSRGVLIVSYPGVVIYQDYLHSFDWHYAILDEGHKIRNPDAQVTLACKRFRTPHRLILSGSPVQNNLKELWSIFDFIYPGKLGTLPVFMEQFAIPITQGGYANASDIQVQIAYKCACVLRDSIKPFLLRRTKAEVNNKLKLPDRSEQVLFCKLTEKQRKLYQMYLDSPTVRDIKRGFCQIFVGLTQLRKICNHPDLFDATECRRQIKQNPQKKHQEFFSEDETYGHFKKSGKMMVVDALLKLWKKQEHKVLLFTQSRQMLKIFTNYLDERNYKHLKMDGETPIGLRQKIIEEFNNNKEVFLFLLTTRVGGVGVNLIGANRIIIYDPDWNPSTDIQARERAWRIGQQRHVIIYRLLTAGTIEEKIYHRQVFKLYLTNRILRDAKQKRFFKMNDMHELFRLGDNDGNFETKALFDDNLQINADTVKKSKRKSKSKKKKDLLNDDSNKQLLSEEKLEAMRAQAKRLSQMIAAQYQPEQLPKSDPSDEPIKVKIEPGLQPVESSTEPNRPSTPVPTLAQFERQNCASPEEKRHKSGKSKKHIKYLVKQDAYKPDNGEPESSSKYKRDDYILSRLFKSSSIFGGLKHDIIETDSGSDYKVVESEAEKVARDAIRALKDSRRMCMDSSFGIPNWTGRNGQVSQLLPKNKGRIQSFMNQTASSSKGDSLLSSIKKRNQSNPVAIARSTFQVGPDSEEEEERDKDFAGRAKDVGADDMADKIRNFLLFRSTTTGEAQTDELLSFFKENFSSDKTAVFKAILYKMCDFNRKKDLGFWKLKQEFRSS